MTWWLPIRWSSAYRHSGTRSLHHKPGGGNDGEQWVGVLDVVIKRQIQTVAQRIDIGSYVVVDGLLPCQIVVAQAVDDDTGTEDIGHQTVEHIGGISLIGREVLVAGLPTRHAA